MSHDVSDPKHMTFARGRRGGLGFNIFEQVANPVEPASGAPFGDGVWQVGVGQDVVGSVAPSSAVQITVLQSVSAPWKTPAPSSQSLWFRPSLHEASLGSQHAPIGMVH